jgi:probable HAF family extracellular repeat protein
MKGKIFVCLMASTLLALVISPLNGAAQGRGGYTVYNLGTTGGSQSAAISINNPRWISGFSALAGNQTTNAVLWRNGQPMNLDTLGGPNSTLAWPNHDPDAVVGISETAVTDPLGEAWSCAAFMPTTGKICLGFFWQNNVMHALPTLGGYNGYAAGANNRDQVVGWAETTYHDPTCVPPQVLQFQAVLWEPNRGRKTVLPPLPGDPDSAATAINNRGVAVGISGICENAVGDQSAEHAVVWQNGQPIDIGNIGGNAWNTPTAINDRGVVVGFAEVPDGNLHAFVWTSRGGMRDLGTLPGDTTSYAYALNEQGQIVGQSIGQNGSRAVIWENGHIADISAVAGGSLTLLYGNDIDDRGRIVGQAYDSSTGDSPAFLAVPNGHHAPDNPNNPDTSFLPQTVWDMLKSAPGLAPIR